MCSGWAGTNSSSNKASTAPAPLTAGPASRSRGDCLWRSTPGSWIRCWAAPPWTASGARSDLSNAPSVDIANGAPTGTDATNQLALTWVDGRDGLNNEHVFFTTSTNDGQSWTGVRTVENEIGHPADRGYYSAPAISPDGRDIYLVYNAFLEPYKTSTIG